MSLKVELNLKLSKMVILDNHLKKLNLKNSRETVYKKDEKSSYFEVVLTEIEIFRKRIFWITHTLD